MSAGSTAETSNVEDDSFVSTASGSFTWVAIRVAHHPCRFEHPIITCVGVPKQPELGTARHHRVAHVGNEEAVQRRAAKLFWRRHRMWHVMCDDNCLRCDDGVRK